MKMFFGGLVALCFIISFSSCQREVDDSFITTPENNVLVKSVVYLDTTKASGADTVFKTEYGYDDSKRLLSISQFEYNSPTSISSFRFEFIYAGSSKVPFKRISTQSSLVPLNSFLTYNSASLVIKDSSFSISPNNVTIQTYSPTASGGFVTVSKQKNLTTGGVIVQDTIVYRRALSAGNILTGIDSNFSYPSLGLRISTHAYTYDNKVNPFASFSIYPCLGNYFFTGEGYILPIGKNNATSFLESYTGSSPISGTISYTYRLDDYPLIGKITGYADANKIIFNYY